MLISPEANQGQEFEYICFIIWENPKSTFNIWERDTGEKRTSTVHIIKVGFGSRINEFQSQWGILGDGEKHPSYPILPPKGNLFSSPLPLTKNCSWVHSLPSIFSLPHAWTDGKSGRVTGTSSRMHVTRMVNVKDIMGGHWCRANWGHMAHSLPYTATAVLKLLLV